MQSHKVRFISKFGLHKVHILVVFVVFVVVAVNTSINSIAKSMVVANNVLANGSLSQCSHNIYDY